MPEFKLTRVRTPESRFLLEREVTLRATEKVSALAEALEGLGYRVVVVEDSDPPHETLVLKPGVPVSIPLRANSEPPLHSASPEVTEIFIRSVGGTQRRLRCTTGGCQSELWRRVSNPSANVVECARCRIRQPVSNEV